MEQEQDVSQAGQRSEDMEKTSGSLYSASQHHMRALLKLIVLKKKKLAA